jgi:hypothetical protein
MEQASPDMTRESRRWRLGLLIGCGLAVGALLVTAFQCTPMLPYCSTTVGFFAHINATSASASVLKVENEGPAWRAGLRVSDQIYFREIGFRERWRLRSVALGYPAPFGERLRYIVHRGKSVFPATIVPQRIPPSWGSWADWNAKLAVLWCIAFAAVLAIRRPDFKEARVMALLLSMLGGMGALQYSIVAPWPEIDFPLAMIGKALLLPGTIGLFAIYFTLISRPMSAARRLLTMSTLGLASLAAIGLVAAYICLYVLALPVPWFFPILICAPPAACLGALLCAFAAIAASRATERQRAIWVTASIGSQLLVWGLTNALLLNPNHETLLALNYAVAVFVICMPVGLTYAVLSRRFIDLGYVINRAAVVAGISVIVVGAFVLLEWALGRWFENASHTTSLVLNVGLALVLGISLRYIHRHVDRFVDRVMFRKRHEDESALRRFAHEASFISDHSTLLERAVQTVKEHTGADDAAILIRDGAASYAFATDGRRELVSQDDPGIVALRAWHKPVDLHEVKDSALHGEFALPMISRGELVGTLICGPKRDGEAYAPDESDALLALAHGVGSALDVLSANRNGDLGVSRQILDELQALHREIAELKRSDDTSRG